MVDFANILFSGRCNARCPFCIGRQLDPRLNEDNLRLFPPRNLEKLIELIGQQEIRQVILTGTNTDPQRYLHEEKLLRRLREQTHPETRIVLHTNGRLALHKIGIFNQYDRVSISFPSFNPLTYRKMMGVPKPPDLKEIIQQSVVPVKVSSVITEDNAGEIDEYLIRCQEMGVRRIVLRKLYGEKQPWETLLRSTLQLTQIGAYRGNPVFRYQGMEVTLWDFEGTESTSINLFSNGVISNLYLLPKTEVVELAHGLRNSIRQSNAN
jgi:molybdenum cofactor biosynthesis enzyme MoaA